MAQCSGMLVDTGVGASIGMGDDGHEAGAMVAMRSGVMVAMKSGMGVTM